MNCDKPRYEILKDSYRDMQSQLEEQFLRAAIEQVESFLKYQPGHATAHNDLGVFYYRKGDKLQALGHYQKANKFAPESAVFRKNLANFYYKEMGWTEEACELYREILRTTPNDVEGLIALATISSACGEADQARAWFEKVLELHGGVSESVPPIKENPPEVQSASTATPRKTVAELHRQACALAASGNETEAIVSLEELLRCDTGHALAHNDLGVLYLRHGNKAGALDQHRQAVTLDPDSAPFAKNLAGIYLEEGMTDEAIFILVDQEKRHPEDIETLTALGNISLTVDHPEEARIFFERVLALQPWNRTAREAVAALQLAPSIPETPPEQSAVETTELGGLLARLRSSISPSETSDALYVKAQTLANAGDTAAAVSQLEALLAQDPGCAAAHNDLGVLRYQMGEQAGALAHHRRAVELAPDNLNYGKNLAGLFLADSATQDDAIFLLTEIIKRHPRDIETLFTLGRLCLELGHPEESGIFLTRLLGYEPWNREAQELLQLCGQVAA
jgi:Flp pilus assembly protein TadD